jgi:hypothetical protein
VLCFVPAISIPPPDKDFCKFNNAIKIKSGHVGKVKLDGLKLWMSGDKDDALKITNTTAPHGEAKDKKQPLAESNPEIGAMQMKGARVLFENAFYSTGALKAMDVLRRYPSLGKFENRLLVAQSLEKANLKGEALNEYVNLSTSKDLLLAQKVVVQEKIAQLKRQ